MKLLRYHFLSLAMLAIAPHDGTAEEHYKEPYWEIHNPVRIFDWDTLEVLRSTKVVKVMIKADSLEELISQLEESILKAKIKEKIRFSFKRQLWEKLRTDGTSEKIKVRVELELESGDLLSLIRYVSELRGMTFSVKKGEIEFRPLIG